MRFVSIASGSSGNCTYIGTDHTHLLVDAGISCKRIDTGVQELGIKPDELAGVLITHEHSDHISGILEQSQKFPGPGVKYDFLCSGHPPAHPRQLDDGIARFLLHRLEIGQKGSIV